MVRTVALIALASASCAAFSDVVDWIAGAKHTYVVLPPQSVTDGTVQSATYSSDGAYLLVAERPIIPDQNLALDIGQADQAGSRAGSLTLLVWDRLHRQIKAEWTGDDPSERIDDVQWIHGTPTALVVMHSVVPTGPVNKPTNKWAVMALDVATGHFEWITGLESLAVEPHVNASPAKAVAVVSFNSSTDSPQANRSVKLHRDLSQQISITLDGSGGGSFSFVPVERANEFFDLDSSGRVVRHVQVQPPLDSGVVWNAAGSEWLIKVEASKSNPNGLARLDDQGTLQPVADSAYKGASITSELTISSERQIAKHGKTEIPYKNLWLVGAGAPDHAELLLAPNAGQAVISPTLDSVCYVDGGVAKMRLIFALPADAGQSLRDADKLRAQSAAAEARRVGQRFSSIRLNFVVTGKSAPPDKPL
jgi:hypothetical protein